MANECGECFSEEKIISDLKLILKLIFAKILQREDPTKDAEGFSTFD